ncbi:MAG: Rpp14/Pop5 family protein [Candidatus Thorarchaeota archaeon]|jgi:RNase P/RNase MRP subunit POP5
MKENRKRYILFKIHQEGPAITIKQLSNAIWKNLLSLFGEVTISDARLYVNEFDEKTGTGFLQCNLTHLENVITAAALIESINDTKISFEPKKTSGTIKALHRKG